LGKEKGRGINMEQVKDLKSHINMSSFIMNKDKVTVSFNEKRDSLFIQLKNPPPAISIDCDGLFWVRVNPITGDVVGIEIEGYRKVFLKRYHELESIQPSAEQPFIERISREVEGCLA
jgi:hypothetical protein